jgi:Catechol dioxygenase N terminus
MKRMAEFTGAERNGFLLLADVLGVSQLVEVIDARKEIVGTWRLVRSVKAFHLLIPPLTTTEESVIWSCGT